MTLLNLIIIIHFYGWKSFQMANNEHIAWTLSPLLDTFMKQLLDLSWYVLTEKSLHCLSPFVLCGLAQGGKKKFNTRCYITFDTFLKIKIYICFAVIFQTALQKCVIYLSKISKFSLCPLFKGMIAKHE